MPLPGFGLSGAGGPLASASFPTGSGRPTGTVPSTHILKPQLNKHDYADLPVNEHLCQTAARHLGLPAAATQVHRIGGTDAHAKNYSLLLGADGDVRLAPLYDLASGLPYVEDENVPKISLAQPIGKNYTLRKSDRRSAWESTADALGLDRASTVERAEQIAGAVPEAFALAASSLPPEYRDLRTVTDLRRRLIRRQRTCSSVSTAAELPS